MNPFWLIGIALMVIPLGALGYIPSFFASMPNWKTFRQKGTYMLYTVCPQTNKRTYHGNAQMYGWAYIKVRFCQKWESMIREQSKEVQWKIGAINQVDSNRIMETRRNANETDRCTT